MSSEIERACWKAWEQGFRAGASPSVSILKNPYSYDGVEHPVPPEFPRFYYRMDENLTESTERWATQMREFKIAWDEWAGGLR